MPITFRCKTKGLMISLAFKSTLILLVVKIFSYTQIQSMPPLFPSLMLFLCCYSGDTLIFQVENQGRVNYKYGSFKSLYDPKVWLVQAVGSKSVDPSTEVQFSFRVLKFWQFFFTKDWLLGMMMPDKAQRKHCSITMELMKIPNARGETCMTYFPVLVHYIRFPRSHHHVMPSDVYISKWA